MKLNKKLVFWSFFILFLFLELIFGKQGLYKLWRLRKERILYIERVNTLRKKNQRLMKEVQRLKCDPEYIEAIIKKEMNMVRDNEIIIYFKE